MKISLSAALALLLLLEGALPLLLPRQWRETWQRIAQLNDGQVRFVGLMMWIVAALILIAVSIFD
jgi:uncharacterized protein YjeT (DUF2065 family)